MLLLFYKTARNGTTNGIAFGGNMRVAVVMEQVGKGNQWKDLLTECIFN